MGHGRTQPPIGEVGVVCVCPYPMNKAKELLDTLYSSRCVSSTRETCAVDEHSPALEPGS
ncbi:hypothetical protein J6590_007125 [Homalodisca vitripennis]|nr:hypothetical protein J6590_007125 [Homalodisca vitripennis]